MTKICVVGLGYIGIPTAVMFASKGFEVVGVEKRENVVNDINHQVLPIEEKGLTSLFLSNPFKASTKAEQADVFIICVGTPINKNDHVNLEAVKSAAISITPFIKKNDLVIVESTIPPGTTQEIVMPIVEKCGLKAGEDFYLVHSPERVIPGNLLYELVHNNRIMGGISELGAIKAKELYEHFVTGEIFLASATTAETSKLMENTFRNVNIAFANEVAKICEKLKINAWEVIELANKHPRVSILNPGPGVGGHCIPVDPWFIVEKVPNQSPLIKLSLESNRKMPQFTVQKITHITGLSSGQTVCLLGATFKANTDDIRESPTFVIEKLLKENGNKVTIFDPHIAAYSQQTLEQACEHADIVVLLVDHAEFKTINFNSLKKVMNQHNLLDCKNFIHKENPIASGFSYYLLGDGSD